MARAITADIAAGRSSSRSTLGEYEEAQPWCERATTAKEKGDIHGRVDYDSVAVSAELLASCLSAVGRDDEAQHCRERAAALRERARR